MDRRGIFVGSDSLVDIRLAHQHVIGGELAVCLRHAEPGRGIALRVEVDHQGRLADGGERGAEVDGGRGFADAALLVGDNKDAWALRHRCGLETWKRHLRCLGFRE